jgi:hypothetical protein
MDGTGPDGLHESAGVSPEDLAAADQQIRDAVTETTGEPFRGFANVGDESRARLSGLERELWDAARLAAAAAEQLPARFARTSRGAARQERRVVTQLVDDRVPFAVLGSLTDRARLRDQVLADLAARRGDRDAGRSQGRGWSL